MEERKKYSDTDSLQFKLEEARRLKIVDRAKAVDNMHYEKINSLVGVAIAAGALAASTMLNSPNTGDFLQMQWEVLNKFICGDFNEFATTFKGSLNYLSPAQLISSACTALEIAKTFHYYKKEKRAEQELDSIREVDKDLITGVDEPFTAMDNNAESYDLGRYAEIQNRGR